MSTTDHTMADSITVGPFTHTTTNSIDGAPIPVHLESPLDPYREWLNRMQRVLSEAPHSNSTDSMSARRQTALTNALAADLRADQHANTEMKCQLNDLQYKNQLLQAEVSRAMIQIRAQRNAVDVLSHSGDVQSIFTNAQGLAALVDAIKCPCCSENMWSAIMLTSCGCIVCVTCVYEHFATQKHHQLDTRHREAALSGHYNAAGRLAVAHTGFMDRYEMVLLIARTCFRDSGPPAPADGIELKCPKCEARVDTPPKSVPLGGWVCTAMMTTNAADTGPLMVVEDLDVFFK
ncbi:uncharacterized protein ARMOST_19315 [Armillaria ostoyae]|uniref:Uncharacterized protein n=1 Tax=Armillaria ostoyae TaxID=47428 RepID=A0A284S471_ARMOS|nr:uncharacterized protein ARMOST_19315 [Armillaria ostoyae]